MVAIQPSITAIIINFNGGPLVVEAVFAALNSTVPVEIIVCDNGSTDDSLSLLRQRFSDEQRVKLLAIGRNLGFARANNIAFQQSKGKYLLLLNPDCIVNTNALELLKSELQSDSKVGMVGPLVLNPDGSEQAGARRAIPTPWRALLRAFGLSRLLGSRFPMFSDYTRNDEPLPEGPVDVEAISGSCMLVDPVVVEEVGPLDEGYFLHVEDLDWCMRFRQTGWRIRFVPEAVVTHYKGTCSKHRRMRVLWHMHKGMVRFYRKFYRNEYSPLLLGLVVVGVWGRFSALAVYQLARYGYRMLKIN